MNDCVRKCSSTSKFRRWVIRLSQWNVFGYFPRWTLPWTPYALGTLSWSCCSSKQDHKTVFAKNMMSLILLTQICYVVKWPHYFVSRDMHKSTPGVLIIWENLSEWNSHLNNTIMSSLKMEVQETERFRNTHITTEYMDKPLYRI